MFFCRFPCLWKRSGPSPSQSISRVKQTGEHLVLDNAAREERLVEDDYIKRERPKSILCAPIIYKSALTGIIYLGK